MKLGKGQADIWKKFGTLKGNEMNMAPLAWPCTTHAFEAKASAVAMLRTRRPLFLDMQPDSSGACVHFKCNVFRPLPMNAFDILLQDM